MQCKQSSKFVPEEIGASLYVKESDVIFHKKCFPYNPIYLWPFCTPHQ